METRFHGQIIKIILSPLNTGGLKVWKIETRVGFINCLCGSLFVGLTQTVEGQYIRIAFCEFDLVENGAN